MVILIGYCYIYMYKCNAFLTTIIDEGRDFVIDYLCDRSGRARSRQPRRTTRHRPPSLTTHERASSYRSTTLLLPLPVVVVPCTSATYCERAAAVCAEQWQRRRPQQAAGARRW